MTGIGRIRAAIGAAGVAGLVFLATGGTAAAAGVCDPIVAASNQVTQEQLAFTIQAYSDNQITPEEAARAEAYSQEIAKITADLGTCLQTGVLPPGYPPVGSVSLPGPPVANHFNVELSRWRIGDAAVSLNWETSEPTKVWIGFYKGNKLVGSINAPMSADSAKFKGKLGNDKKPKAGKGGGIKVEPGTYQLKLIATDTDGDQSDPLTAKLKVLPKKH